MSSPDEGFPSPEDALPDGWVLCESKSLPGRKYYFDRRSGSSLWTKPPPDPEKTPKNKTRKCRKHKEQPSPSKPPHRDDVSKCNSHHSSKRKGDSSNNAPSKRSRQEPSGSDYQHSDVSGSSNVTPQYSKSTPSSSKELLPKHGSGKNSANKRMENLRSLLHREEEPIESPSPRGLYQHDTHWRSQDFVSPIQDHSGRDGHRYSPNDRHSQNKEHKATNNSQNKPYIPKNSVKDALSPSSADFSTTNVSTHQGNDSLEIISSPSQFFEANKIICSLKAQLPESGEGRSGADTFAAIEQGINAHNIEYSSKSHPATPPHFVHASQIVSSIRSRLTENISDCERKPRYRTQANDRLSALRNSLQSPIDNAKHNNNVQNQPQATTKPVLFENKNVSKPADNVQSQLGQNSIGYLSKQKSEDMMEVETREARERRNSDNHSSCTVTSDTQASDNLVLVVDTNIFIHDLQFLKTVLDSYIAGYKERPTLMVPWQVINELDRLKDNNNGNKSVCSKAKVATDYLYHVLPSNIRIKGQTLRDAGNHIYPCELPDDEILNCCLQQGQRGNAVMLLSNDKHLCTRATVNGVRALGTRELEELLRAETERGDARARLQHYERCIHQLLSNILEVNHSRRLHRAAPQMLLSNDKHLCTRATVNGVRALGTRELEELLRAETERGDARARLQHYERCIHQLLSNILENEMRARYEQLWQHVLFKAPPWSLLDVLQSLLKHWVAVFSEVFPRIEPLVQQLKQQLTRIHDRGGRVSPSEVSAFREQACELAHRCQIIPEYMALARRTAERLGAAGGAGGGASPPPAPPPPPAAPPDDERGVVGAFEGIWTAFSSYCARLATMLGVSHQLDDRQDNVETTESLRNKWPEYSKHIQSMAYALKRTLTANENSSIEPLHSTMSDCLACVGGDRNSIDNDSLRTFCLNNRNMIHEALVKFTQLTEVLAHCRSAFGK